MGLFGKKTSAQKDIFTEQEARCLLRDTFSRAANDVRNVDVRSILENAILESKVQELRKTFDTAVFNETTGDAMYHRLLVNCESTVLSDCEFREYCKSHKVDHYNEKGDFVFNPETELAFARTVINQEYVDAMKSGEFDLRCGYKVPEYFDIKKHLALTIASYGGDGVDVAFAIFNDTVVKTGIYHRLGKYTNAQINSQLHDSGRVFIITDFNDEVVETFKNMNVYFSNPEYELYKKYNKRFLESDPLFDLEKMERLIEKCEEVNEYFREKHGSSCKKATAF